MTGCFTHPCPIAECFLSSTPQQTHSNSNPTSVAPHAYESLVFPSTPTAWIDHNPQAWDCFFADDMVPLESPTLQAELKLGTRNDSVPTTIILPRMINNLRVSRPLTVLLDSGSDFSHINRAALPPGVVPIPLQQPCRSQTLHGTTSVDHGVVLSDIVLPEFATGRRISDLSCTVFDAPCAYDAILGRDFLLRAGGIDVCFSTQSIKWMGATIPMRARNSLQEPASRDAHYLDQLTDEFSSPLFDSYTSIRPTEYKEEDLKQLLEEQMHLTKEQREDLGTLWSEFTQLFNGKLGLYPHRQLDLELIPGAKPVHQRAYPVPHVHREVFKQELRRLVELGVLEPTGSSEWAAPSFIIPKKDGTVRWLTDFRELNKCIKRKKYPLPRISDIMTKRSGYRFFVKLDISMLFYHFGLTERSKDYLTIVTPFGKFRYGRVPMGITPAPDLAQEIMEDILRDIEECDVYMDDIGIFATSWSHLLSVLRRVLQRLQDSNLTINPSKCQWAVKEVEWLGFWLTPDGLQPWRKKIDAILQLDTPKTLKQVRSFIGAITYYRDMYPKRSHILAPLTEITGKKEFKWTPACDKAFKQMKALLVEDTLLRYPDPNKPFHIYTDASDYQLGAVIKQDNHPVAYYSRKLNSAQKNYTTMEKELLSIVATLKEFRTILYGAEIHVHTDHRNLTFANLNSQRVIRWRLYVEEYNPVFHYIKGEDNQEADALSRLPMTELQEPDDDNFHDDNFPDAYSMFTNVDVQTCLQELPAYDLDDCYLFHPVANNPNGVFPVDFDLLQLRQQQDQGLQTMAVARPDKYPSVRMGPNTTLICHIAKRGAPWKICIPNEMLIPIIRWYHLVLSHVGMTRLYDTIATHFYHYDLKSQVEDFVSKCDACQRYKLVGRGHGELPPKDAPVAPWSEVHVDLIGPWHITVNGVDLEFKALTCIDPVLNIAELVRINNQSSPHVAMRFENEWLSRYPRPETCVHDPGPEFVGTAFQRILWLNGIKGRPTSVKNPQANAIVERLHQTVANSLRTLAHGHNIANLQDAQDLMDTALATASYAVRSAIHRTLRASPGALVFQRDMILNIPIIADLETIRARRQIVIDENLRRQNLRRHQHDYQPGEQVLVLTFRPNKLEPRAKGPFRIDRVHANGTITIRRSAHVTERINIRRVRPYRT